MKCHTCDHGTFVRVTWLVHKCTVTLTYVYICVDIVGACGRSRRVRSCSHVMCPIHMNIHTHKHTHM